MSFFSTEYGYLIHLLYCAIHDTTPDEKPEQLSFDRIYGYAMEHDVANLAFYAVERLQNQPDRDLCAKWGRRRDLALMRDMHQEFARNEIVAEFRSRGIPYKELQGTVLKKLYPRTEYRTMSDLDFIVEKKHLTQCGKILEDLGYRCSKQDDFEIDGIRKPDICVELHTDYFSPYTVYYDIMREPVFDREISEEEKDTELYLYNILHIAKHYFSGGCGIRRILDMYYIDRCYRDKIDSDHVRRVLSEAGMLQFAQEIIDLAHSWFGEAGRDDKHSAMEQMIVDAGLHGKRENYISRRIRRKDKDASLSASAKAKYLRSRIFPGAKVMEIKYPVLKRIKILYPFCWGHRIIRMILGRNRQASLLDLRLVLRAEEKDS